MLIDVSYFTEGPRHILNASPNTASALAKGQNALAVNERIESYIKYYQHQFLEKMLGNSLCSLVEVYIGGDEVDADEDYEELLMRLKEPFADYVYYYILRTSNTKSTITGLAVLKNDNKVISPNVDMVRAWNSMVDKNIDFVKWAETCPFNVEISESMLTHINTLGL